MREEFEKLPDIKRKMAMLIKYDADSEMYKYMGVSIDEFYAAKLNFINGAWYAYQEQQKKIDMQECGAKEIISIINSITPYEYDLDTMSKINKIKELLK